MTLHKEVVCPLCDEEVLLNGIGSSRNWVQKSLTFMLQLMIPYTTKVFMPASDWHDLIVHQGRPDYIYFGDWHRAIDGEFYSMCKAIANSQKNWLKRKYLNKQADELYAALRFNNGSGYDKIDCVVRKRIRERYGRE